MISVDTNVLLYAFRAFEPDHLVAKQTLETLLSQKEFVAFTDIVINEFIANATNKRLRVPVTSVERAVKQVENWLSATNVEVIRNSPENFATFTRLCGQTGRTGQEIYDAQIAAICIDNGVTEFITNDSGFEKFTELRIRNPFAA
jgi:toxin-antitoxin system PIN domain toxin